MKKLGFIINPIAGLGGKAGLKGSDCQQVTNKALKLGIRPESGERAKIALQEIELLLRDKVIYYTAPLEMGENVARAIGINPIIVGKITSGQTKASDTEKIAKQMEEIGVDLLIFVGGDGTARNIYNAVCTKLPVLGVPAGVKMHSAVFAITPKNAAEIVYKFLNNILATKEAEVMDIDEDMFRKGIVMAKLYGYLTVPYDMNLLQGTKVGGINTQRSELYGIARDVQERMEKEDGYIYIIGPGSTTGAIMEKLRLDYTLLGVDVVYKKKLIKKDVNEVDLKYLLKDKPAKIVITLIGGQGFIFGRGNQQISSEIIKSVGKDNIIIVSPLEKIISSKGCLFVDTGDEKVDNILRGSNRIVTGYHCEHVCTIRGRES